MGAVTLPYAWLKGSPGVPLGVGLGVHMDANAAPTNNGRRDVDDIEGLLAMHGAESRGCVVKLVRATPLPFEKLPGFSETPVFGICTRTRRR
jgi:hypothetical protein